MRTAVLALALIMALACRSGQCQEETPANAMMPEQLRSALSQLNAVDFAQREAAGAELFQMGRNAVPALMDAATSRTAEVSVRAFDILQRLYRGEDEATFEAVETTLGKLKHVDNVAVAARAERAFENGSDTRQNRAIGQFERLGGIINFAEPRGDRQFLNRPRIENIMLGDDWVGGDTGLQLLGRIEDLRTSRSSLYIIRGVQVSEEAKINLLAELPFMEIQYRGPARLGIRSSASPREEGCFISDVDPDSAAERAGLRRNDQVLEIAGEPVESFSDLIAIIERKQPGTKVPILYHRNSETHTTVAELLPWPPAKFPRAKR